MARQKSAIAAARPLTLAIDIGGSHLKAGILGPDGGMNSGPERVETPRPAVPEALIAALGDLVRTLVPFDRVSVGFPGAIRAGRVQSAPNLDGASWPGTDLGARLAERLGRPVRLLNDATVQGLGVIRGQGLECVLTLGTGMGFAMFQDGLPAPHLELSRHPVHGDKTYDGYIGEAALRKVGHKRWNRRVLKAIGHIEALTGYDALYVGGGNARHVSFDLPPRLHLVSNEAGITGGLMLWSPRLDPVFADQAHAQDGARA